MEGTVGSRFQGIEGKVRREVSRFIREGGDVSSSRGKGREVLRFRREDGMF